MASAKALGSGRATRGRRVGEGGGESAGEVRGQTPQDRVGYGEDLSSIQARWLGGHQGGRVAAEREVTGMTQMPCRRCRGDKTWDRKGRRQERLRRFCPGQQRTVVCIPKTGCGVPWALSSMHPGSHFLIKPRSAVLRPHELMPRVCISVLLLIFYLPFDFFHCLMSYLEVFDSKYLENFPDIFLLLIFTLISVWSENVRSLILNTLRLVLWSIICFFLVNVLCALEEIVPPAVGQRVLINVDKSHWCFIWHFPFHALIGLMYIFSGNMSFKSVAHFNWVIVFLILNCKSSSYILDESLLSDTCFSNIFSKSLTCLLIFLTSFLKCKSFTF